MILQFVYFDNIPAWLPDLAFGIIRLHVNEVRQSILIELFELDIESFLVIPGECSDSLNRSLEVIHKFPFEVHDFRAQQVLVDPIVFLTWADIVIYHFNAKPSRQDC